MNMEAAIIAGVGPGTGAALARAFAKEGYAIGLLSRHLESSQPVADEIRARGGKALVVPTDVTVRQSTQTAVAEIRNHFGPITALAHNASGYGRANFLEMDPEQVRQSFDANVMGAVYLAQAVIPDMLKAGLDAEKSFVDHAEKPADRVTSPAANTCRAEVLRDAEVRTPLSTARPDPVSHSVSGTVPTPTTTRSASSVEPSASTNPSTRC